MGRAGSHNCESFFEEQYMDAVNEVPSPLIFTDSAASKVKELIEEEE